MKSSYSTADLARILEVNESTVKRWADNGHIECIKTKGGHRRFTVGAVLKFAQENKITLPSLDVDVITDNDLHAHVVAGNISKLVPDLKRGALEGDVDAVMSILRIGLASRPDLLRLYHELVFPPLVDIGNDWALGKITVDEEHLATQAMKDAIIRLQAEVHQKSANGKVVLAASYEDDLHDFGLRCAANYFASEGWRVVFLGQMTPTTSLLHAIEKHHPSLVLLSLIVAKDEDRFITDVNNRILPAVNAIGASLDIGGANVSMRFAKRIPGATFTDSILQYAELAHSAAKS